jgi:hypothetical protein
MLRNGNAMPFTKRILTVIMLRTYIKLSIAAEHEYD